MGQVYEIFPKVQRIEHMEGSFTLEPGLKIVSTQKQPADLIAAGLETLTGSVYAISIVPKTDSLERLYIGEPLLRGSDVPSSGQGYSIQVGNEGILVSAKHARGLYYGSLSLGQMLAQHEGGRLPNAAIQDFPALPNRGLMLDMSRGRVYTLDFLKNLADRLASMKMNVLQLYIEHTFAFPSFPEIGEGADPITPGEIEELDRYCGERHIELQANLQSFGHCNRILTSRRFRALRESDLYWTLSPAVPQSYELLGEMYAEYLPHFTSERFNVCSDETYDLGMGKSAAAEKTLGRGRLYLGHLLRLRELAARQGKKLMVFGDVILKHPDLIAEIPDDIVFLDWIYDPLESYETPKAFARAGKRFWVCPGTGFWNSLFPRQEGAVRNILGLTKSGIENGAEGMLLTDWGDHGNYGMPVTALYAYGIASAAAWNGAALSREEAEAGLDALLEEPAYTKLQKKLEEIYRLPALWSKNRSQCVMALFDEPIMGKTLTGRLPPPELEALKPLPKGIGGVMDPESHHPMRPFFQLSAATIEAIDRIADEARPLVEAIEDPDLRSQYGIILQAFGAMTGKLRLGRTIRDRFAAASLTVDDFLDWDRELRLLARDYVDLEMRFSSEWLTFAKPSEIAITMTYFAHIIERLDYLRHWLEAQRVSLERLIEPDYSFSSYETAGYKTLPTY